MIHPKLNLHRIHKWMGLTASAWLLVLGLTGFVLDHRDAWRWLWQEGIAGKWITQSIIDKSQSGQIRLYQVNPDDSKQQMAGGLTGLWWTHDSGKTWQQTRFNGVASPPMLTAIFYSGDKLVWIASDDGVWLSTNAGESALRIVLAGHPVTALSPGNDADEIIGVRDRSRIFKYRISNKKITWPELQAVVETELPKSISLSRYTRDVHYGRGVFKAPVSLFWNDMAGIAMFVLPMTGFLFYWLPRRWRKNKLRQNNVSHNFKKQSMRWLYRLHAPSFGLLASIPLVYLSASGILIGHSNELRHWMNSIQVTHTWQTPVYHFDSWNNEIYGVVSYAGQPEKFSIATRLGLFTTRNNGSNWVREHTSGDKALFVWTLRKFKDAIYLGGMGGPNMAKQGNKPWRVVNGSGHMPGDITLDENANVIWNSHHGLLSPGASPGVNTRVVFPASIYIPWFYIIDGLHSGMLLHAQWKWVNDLFAVLAFFLVVTGLLRWWRKKWI